MIDLSSIVNGLIVAAIVGVIGIGRKALKSRSTIINIKSTKNKVVVHRDSDTTKIEIN